MVAGDFNGDNNADLAVGTGANTISISLGDGHGDFTPAPGSPVPGGAGPIALATGDFNGDNKLDIVAADYTGGTATVLLGHGNGTFTQAPGSPVTLGPHPRDIVVADFNHDGHPDIAATTDAGTAVLLGSGNGRFSPAPGSPIASGACPDALAAGFFDQFAQAPDLAVADGCNDTVSVLRNNGSAHFTPAGPPVSDGDPTYCTSNCLYDALSIVAGEFRTGGIFDVAVGHEDGKISVLLGDGHGGLSLAPGSPFPARSDGRSTQVTHLVTGYFGNNGQLDLAASGYWQGGCANPPCDLPPNAVSVLLGDGTGRFSQAPGSPYLLSGVAGDLATGDFYNNGHNDLVSTDLYSCHGNDAQVLVNQGVNGGESPPANVYSGDGCSGGCPVRPIRGKLEPALVAVFVDGVQTSTPNDDFYPLDYGFSGSPAHPAIDSYCSPYNAASYGRYPPSVSGVLGGYYGTLNPPPSLGSEILTDTLAKQGAVLLPYSYHGAYFSSCPGGNTAPLFHVNYSSSRDPGNTDPNTEAGYLWGEVQSIHSCWPDAAIDVIADSGGGVPAEYYWNTAFQNERDGVRHVFTLDSPINGLDHTSIESIVDNHLGSVVRNFYGVLWDNLDSNDAGELGKDGNGSFRPVGTIGDYAYALGDMRWSLNFDPNANDQQAALNALLSQVLMNCSGGLSDTCSVAGPSYVSPCRGTQYSGDPSHEVVRICKPTVDYIAGITAGDLSAIVGTDARSGRGYGARSSAARDGRRAPPAESAAVRAPQRSVAGPAGPAIEPLLYAAAPGSRITLHGHGLGPSPGGVTFSGASGPGTVAAHVVSWSDGAVTVVVPKARSGPIILRTSSGDTFPASSLAVLSRGRVAHLRVRASRPSTGGAREYVYVTAVDRRFRAVPRAVVDLFNGTNELRATTNGKGTATFALSDFGEQDLLVHSGGAAKGVRLVWRPARERPFAEVGVALLHAQKGRRDRLRLRVTSPLRGTVTASVAICGRLRGACGRMIKFGTAHATSAGAATLSLSVSPTKAAVRALRHGRRVRVRIALTLVAALTHSRTTVTRFAVVSF